MRLPHTAVRLLKYCNLVVSRARITCKTLYTLTVAKARCVYHTSAVRVLVGQVRAADDKEYGKYR